MKLTVFTIVFVQSTIANFHSCSHNEFCIDIKECPTYKQYASVSFQTWPENVRTEAKAKHCNTEMLDDRTILSVCCRSAMNSLSCGFRTNDRIIGYGQVASLFHYPWMALLRDQNGRFMCCGTLVSTRYVLTAAHCVRHGLISSVRLGEHDIDQAVDCDGDDDCAPPPQDILVEGTIRHPKYSARKKKNDIALLRLASSAVLGESVNTICLPDGTPQQRMLKPSIYTVSGWGITENGTTSNVLRFGRVPAVTLQECSIKYRKLHPTVKLDESHFCAGGVDQVDHCSGDSGGPLQYLRRDRYVQQGVVAFGVKTCGEENEPGVYTNVEHFISWLVQHVDE